MLKPKGDSHNALIRSSAVEIGHICVFEYWVVPKPTQLAKELVGIEKVIDPNGAPYKHLMAISQGYNGYVLFPKRPVREKGYHGILDYVPVHGGITYAEEDELGMVYGFDTSHYNSQDLPIKEPNWIKHQCAVMLNGVAVAAEVEKNYLRCKTNRGKSRHIEKVLAVQPEDEGNFDMNLNLLAGKL